MVKDVEEGKWGPGGGKGEVGEGVSAVGVTRCCDEG